MSILFCSAGRDSLVQNEGMNTQDNKTIDSYRRAHTRKTYSENSRLILYANAIRQGVPSPIAKYDDWKNEKKNNQTIELEWDNLPKCCYDWTWEVIVQGCRGIAGPVRFACAARIPGEKWHDLSSWILHAVCCHFRQTWDKNRKKKFKKRRKNEDMNDFTEISVKTKRKNKQEHVNLIRTRLYQNDV